MRVPFLVICLLAAAAIGGAAAQTTATIAESGATVTGVTVTNAGTYTGQSASGPAHAGQLSPTGTVGVAVDWQFVSDAQDVAGKVGTQFGIEFRIDGTPPGDGVTLHLVLAFPPQGVRKPNTGETMHAANIAFPTRPSRTVRSSCSAPAKRATFAAPTTLAKRPLRAAICASPACSRAVRFTPLL